REVLDGALACREQPDPDAVATRERPVAHDVAIAVEHTVERLSIVARVRGIDLRRLDRREVHAREIEVHVEAHVPAVAAGGVLELRDGGDGVWIRGAAVAGREVDLRRAGARARLAGARVQTRVGAAGRAVGEGVADAHARLASGPRVALVGVLANISVGLG